MNVFDLRNRLVDDYNNYISSFINIQDERIRLRVESELKNGLLWPDALIQLNPAFEPGHSIDELVQQGVLHQTCGLIFRRKDEIDSGGKDLRLHKHQEDAIRAAQTGKNYVLTTGTGSGKSLAYIIPIVDSILKHGSGKGTKAIIVYPMNALANSQVGELNKYINLGFDDNKGPVTFARYTGQESDEDKKRIMSNPPDILLTNYIMLELILTRPDERKTLVNAAQGLRFLVLDELHTYRGRQGADVAMLIRRVRNMLNAHNLQCIGTSATLASSGSLEDQRKVVAQGASQLFGSPVLPEQIIGETLRRETTEYDFSNDENVELLSNRVEEAVFNPPTDYDQITSDILAAWIETTLGVETDQESGILIRTKPKSILGKDGAALMLSSLTKVSESTCREAIIKMLLAGFGIPKPESGLPTFAFRLHQFISRGDTVYASIEKEEKRYITVNGQQFVPGDRNKILLPLAFCRECGQEYYVVKKVKDQESGLEYLTKRKLSDRKVEDGDAGYLYFNSKDPWPENPEDIVLKLPENWIEEHHGELRVRQSQKKNLPLSTLVDTDGCFKEDEGIRVQYLNAPFRFCLNCGVTYSSRTSSDFSKLTELSSGGRSTDTTILSLALIQYLKADESLSLKARKLLSFTDNRQDASLQAGHLNDFVEISILRAAIYKAVAMAGAAGISHEVLPQKVYEALSLPIHLFALDPHVRFANKLEAEKAMREVLGYRIYRDLKRGWRITSPNLEQCGLLEIEYHALTQVCEAEDLWEGHPALLSASPQTREQICKVLLDFMRRELAIKVNYLEDAHQYSLRQLSSQHLKEPWAIDEQERMDHDIYLFPRSRQEMEVYGGAVFLSSRGGFGQYLRRDSTIPEYTQTLTLDDTQIMINQILLALEDGGLVLEVTKDQNEVSAYQVRASTFIWKAGTGEKAFHDPIRVPRESESGGRTNPFFVNFYQMEAEKLQGLEAHEHTAQVPSDIREEREAAFRAGDLPIMYCSPTMELGVDISELNAVNMRNMPPTPANYAQRSGRAGRSGQPALVFTYCSVGSPHDQYYFKRPEQMVAGAVSPPRLDLTNENLLRSHMQAIWLAETGLDLQTSLKDLLDLTGSEPSLNPLENVQAALQSESARKKAKQRAKQVLISIEQDLIHAGWNLDAWLDDVMDQIALQFDEACSRWKELFRAAKGQQKAMNAIINDMSRSAIDRDKAKRLRAEAEAQIELLTETKNLIQSDFYSYRYFASEGFLPGYSFPRLPLSAYIPGRRIKGNQDEFLSRPRFLAISEFGPRSIVYHEGSRYVINKVNLPVSDDGEDIATSRAKQCGVCGYFHPIVEGDGPDRCEYCNAMLDQPLTSLFRLQNVSTKRRDRISSDEEERMRQGFELSTTIRFKQTQTGVPDVQTAIIRQGDHELAEMTYASSADIWRINLGWRRREIKELKGFMLDVEQGYWAKQPKDDEDQDDALSTRVKRVIPFVKDTKNCLLFQPKDYMDKAAMASLQAALKSAIQVRYQLEDNELAAEPLPNLDERRLILLYESAEGGAGVLRRLLEDPNAMAEIAAEALKICHFDPETGEDKKRGPKATEDCEAACYDCLMSYYNQMDHEALDRHTIVNFLLDMINSTVSISPKPIPRAVHLQQLKNLCQSDLEKKWLDFLEKHNLNLPSHAQELITSCHTRPDFLYKQHHLAIYVDGPHHQYPERQNRDKQQEECLEDSGYTVLRFTLFSEWEETVNQFASLFGQTNT